MIINLGPKVIAWLAKAFTDVLRNGQLPKNWKNVKVIAILTPGKSAEDPANYRPTSLLSCIYKHFERIILTRITPITEQEIPPEQSGFRQNRNTTEQVLALTSHIEAGFEKKQELCL